MTQGLSGYNIATGSQGYSVNNSNPTQAGGLTSYMGPESANGLYTQDQFGVTTNMASPGVFDPNAAYASAVDTSQGQAQNYNTMAAQAMQNKAPTLANTNGQQLQQIQSAANGQAALAKSLQSAAANGQNSQAYNQYQSSLRQNLLSQQALANSAGGNGVNAAGARRAAQEQNAMTAAGSTAGGQLVAQQAQQSAQGQLANTLGQQGSLLNQNYALNQQNAYAQAQLQQQQQQLNNAGQLGYNNLSYQEQQNQLNAMNNATQGIVGSEQVAQGQQVVNNTQNQAMTGMAMGAAGGVLGIGGQGLSALTKNNQTPPANAISSSPSAPQSFGPSDVDTSDFGDTGDN